jgi:PIN domain nuclease of toxin-antitoxin system
MLIFDSHILIWMLQEPARIHPQTYTKLRTRKERILVSMATVWELEIKRNLGKLDLGGFDWGLAIADETLEILDITLEDALRAAHLPPVNRDPFDRMIAAQALNRNARVVTRDGVFGAYGVSVIKG